MAKISIICNHKVLDLRIKLINVIKKVEPLYFSLIIKSIVHVDNKIVILMSNVPNTIY